MGRRHSDSAEATSQRRYEQRFEFRHAAPKKGKRKLKSPLWAKLCVIFGAVLLLFSTSAYGANWFIKHRYDNNVNRADLLGSNRKHGSNSVKGPLNFLIIGSDSRDTEDYNPKDPSSRKSSVDGERSDTIILVHIPKGNGHAYIISIPRDSYVTIPAQQGTSSVGGKDKINASYAWGGAPLLISTVQNLLDIKIDYPIIVDFGAVRELTDAVGGVDVDVDQTTTDPRSKRTFKQGKNHLDGQAAEDFVRQRYGLPNSDYDRQKRQQQFMLAFMKKVKENGALANPTKLDKLLRIATKNLTVDKSMPSLSDFAFSFKTLSPSDASFMTLPMAGEHTDSFAEIVDSEGVQALGEALNNDTMDAYLQQYPPNDLLKVN